MTDEAQHTDAIQMAVATFASQHFDTELAEFANRLLARLDRKKALDLGRGRPEIWAAAIVYVIARANFLFDKESRLRLTPDDISTHFGTSKSTTSQKAALIEKACRIRMGDAEFCRAEIADALTLVRLPGGFIAPLSMLRPKGDQGSRYDGVRPNGPASP